MGARAGRRVDGVGDAGRTTSRKAGFFLRADSRVGSWAEATNGSVPHRVLSGGGWVTAEEAALVWPAPSVREVIYRRKGQVQPITHSGIEFSGIDRKHASLLPPSPFIRLSEATQMKMEERT